jgi:hypothetical protein
MVVEFQSFLTSALDKSEYSASRSGGFTPAEISSYAYRIGVSKRTNIGVEALERGKKICNCVRKRRNFVERLQPSNC